MFTGIIETLGRVETVSPAEGGVRVSVVPECAFEDLEVGESIATNGVCLTAEPESSGSRLLFFVSSETLEKSSIGGLKAGERVNLERSLAAGQRLGGHLVMGHVDVVGRIRRLDQSGEAWDLEVECPTSFRPYLAPKGSVAVDGISLTVVELTDAGFTVAVIPHTYDATALKGKGAGSSVNLEADTIARYVVQFLSNVELGGGGGGVNAELLKRSGFA